MILRPGKLPLLNRKKFHRVHSLYLISELISVFWLLSEILKTPTTMLVVCDHRNKILLQIVIVHDNNHLSGCLNRRTKNYTQSGASMQRWPCG